jgi:hypothetical protein
MAQVSPPGDPSCALPPVYFPAALNDAERLLHYAAEVGIDVDVDTRGAILRARAACAGGWTEEIGANLLAALTKLAARLKPVTAESLKAYHDDTRRTVRSYLKMAIVLALIIVPASLVTFITSALSTDITNDITRANVLAVKLRTELGPASPPSSTRSSPPTAHDIPKTRWWPIPCGRPASGAPAVPPNFDPQPESTAQPKTIPEGSDAIADLQEYASLVRLINYRARKLDWFVFCVEPLPYEDAASLSWEQRKRYFELQVGIPDPVGDRDRITETYQHIRYFAQTIIADISVFYGAFTTCILPALYALLGTCAYLLRSFEDQMSTRTFTPSAANSARFLIAAIGGAVVGLFSKFTMTQEATISPLAIAFLVGYAVDVFFAFLEGLLKAFTKAAPAPSPPAHTQPPESA